MEPSVDTLGRWMAHYIAELIDAASHAPPEERGSAQKRCFDAILELWSHRADLPDGKRPFENLEEITRAIVSLDPDDNAPRHYRTLRYSIVEEDEEPKPRTLFEFVHNIDSTAKTLIAGTLAEAARSAIDKGKEWVALAEDAEADPGIYDLVIQFASPEPDLEKPPDPHEAERKLLQDRLKRLESFAQMAAVHSKSLKVRREALPEPEETA